MSLGKKKAAKAENHERWLITYADLITLLLVFFIVLYAGSQEDSKKFAILAQGLRSAFNNPSNSGAGGQSAVFTGSGASDQGGVSQQQQVDFQAIQSLIQQLSQKKGLGDAIHVREAPDEIDIDLTSDLLFPSGGADLRTEAGPALDAVAQAIKDKPNQIRIEGHTDNIPINTVQFNSNWELSAGRATAVLRYLVESDGLPADHLFAAAYADTHPVADNSSADGRAQNRRAEIVLLYPAPTDPTASDSATPAPSATPAAAR
jgi:chemotaxis protein MotB